MRIASALVWGAPMTTTTRPVASNPKDANCSDGDNQSERVRNYLDLWEENLVRLALKGSDLGPEAGRRR